MNVLLVAYDLNKEIVRPNITKEVKKTAWARLSESSYALRTNETADEVFKRFEYLIDKNDNLYVIPLTQLYAGCGPEQVIDWLDRHLPWLE